MSVSIPIIAPTPSSHSSSLSVYEQERQKNIEKNKAVLAELGLGDARKQLIETHVCIYPIIIICFVVGVLS